MSYTEIEEEDREAYANKWKESKTPPRGKETMNREEIKEYLEDNYPDAEVLLVDGHDNAFLGIETVVGDPRSVYCRSRIINNLILEGMSDEEAQEFFDYNIGGAYVGPNTPLYIDTNRISIID